MGWARCLLGEGGRRIGTVYGRTAGNGQPSLESHAGPADACGVEGERSGKPTVSEAMMDIRDVPVDDLVLDPNLNLRDRLDDFTVERYADSWDRMPPITVFEVEGRYLIADG